MKVRVNKRRNSKHAEAREWAYDLIANSTGTTLSEMADMMVEQFGQPKSSMSHTLLQMVNGGVLKKVGTTVHNGKRTYVVAAVRRARPAHDIADQGTLAPIPPKPVTNGGFGVYVVVETDGGPVKITVEQAKTLIAALGSAFK